MSLIVIGFGGTGAKMIQSLVLMGAAGALRLPRQVKLLLVDQDKGNGNTLRTVATIEAYRSVREILGENGGPAKPYNVDFQIYSELVWQPLTSHGETLGSWFGHDNLSKADDRDMNSRLMELLYSDAQLAEPLGKGFLGNPNVGAPIFADTIDFREQPWRDLDQDIGAGLNQQGTRIVLCGSVFGGTGAAGIPNTAKILRHRLKTAHNNPGYDRAKIILNLAMPYFSIREVDGAAIQAAGRDFLPNCKAALRYYHEQRYLDFCDAIYVLGEADMAPIEKSCLGDREQENPAHPLELFAACNIFDALVSDDLNSKFILTRRARKEEYAWSDLPLCEPEDLRDFIRARMGAFARFCFAFLTTKQGMVNFNSRGAKGLEWLDNFFPKSRDLDLNQMSRIEASCRLYLRWIGEMQCSAASISDKSQAYLAKLFDERVIVTGSSREMNVQLKELEQQGLERLLLPIRTEESCSYRDLHNYLVGLRHTAQGFTGLVNSMYFGCGRNITGFRPEVGGTPDGGR